MIGKHRASLALRVEMLVEPPEFRRPSRNFRRSWSAYRIGGFCPSCPNIQCCNNLRIAKRIFNSWREDCLNTCRLRGGEVQDPLLLSLMKIRSRGTVPGSHPLFALGACLVTVAQRWPGRPFPGM